MRRLVIVAGAALLATATPSAAQTVMPPVLSFTGGVMRYTLGDTRDGAFAAIRLASPIVPLGRNHWLVEAGGGYGWYRTADGDLRHVFIPELQLQLQAGPRGLQPYVGGGGGLAFTKVDSTTTTKLTASAAAGLRIMLGSWGVAGEVRFRSMPLFDKGSHELTFSLFRQLE
jgi:hypothetical protein